MRRMILALSLLLIPALAVTAIEVANLDADTTAIQGEGQSARCGRVRGFFQRWRERRQERRGGASFGGCC